MDRAARIRKTLDEFDTVVDEKRDETLLQQFYRLIDERRRGGLPGQSFGDAVRSSEHGGIAVYGGSFDEKTGKRRPLSCFDPYDMTLNETEEEAARLWRLVENYRQAGNLPAIERELGKIHNLVQSVTAVFIPKPRPEAIPCSNTKCLPEPDPRMPDETRFGFLSERDLEEGRRSGECNRCRAWRSKHDGLAFPNQSRPGELHEENEVA